MKLDPFSIYWIFWFVVGFGGPEAWALWHNVRNTLSYQVWGLEGSGVTSVRIIFCVFLVWLTGHMIFGIWRG